MSYFEFDASTTDEQLKVIRHLLVSARRLMWDIDEGKSSDPRFQCRVYEEGGMHPDVRKFQSHIDECIALTAQMQRKT